MRGEEVPFPRGRSRKKMGTFGEGPSVWIDQRHGGQETRASRHSQPSMAGTLRISVRRVQVVRWPSDAGHVRVRDAVQTSGCKGTAACDWRSWTP